jgi:hypothetical protein
LILTKQKLRIKTERYFKTQENPTLTLPEGEGIAVLSPSPSGRVGVGFADIYEIIVYCIMLVSPLFFVERS